MLIMTFVIDFLRALNTKFTKNTKNTKITKNI
jgi:hypothetical protein